MVSSIIIIFGLPTLVVSLQFSHAIETRHLAASSVARPAMQPAMGLFDFMMGSGLTEGTSALETPPAGYADVSHILLGSDDDATIIQARIEAGDITFSEAARESSLCRSKTKGGRLGAFRGPTAAMPLGLGRVWNLPYEGKEVPAFDSLVFSPSTDTGVIYKVNTAFGFHLVLINARGPPDAS